MQGEETIDLGGTWSNETDTKKSYVMDCTSFSLSKEFMLISIESLKPVKSDTPAPFPV